nr:uncharacterized protein LOC107451476 isoform X2 [Parasteatoda tepidariorum]
MTTNNEKDPLNLDNILIVRKIPEVKEITDPEDSDSSETSENFERDIKRELQALHADERGRLALINELAEIKKSREKQCEAQRRRQKVLEMEKQRSKHIAGLPPPLPASIRSLLKERDKKNCECKEMNECQESEQPFVGVQGTAFGTKRDYNLAYDFDNKENFLTEEEREERERIQAENDMKARKRYNDALKKDRMKQECDEALRQIQNAELANRRLQAKHISSKGGIVPCSAPDKLKHGEEQVRMEDAVETIYKNNPKEHAIEDLEGYEDQWEQKYREVDSNRLVDCIPRYVRDNYSYLLEDESAFRCGNRFSGFDDSYDQLNTAYIASPPATGGTADGIASSEELQTIINELDKMRAERKELYEAEFMHFLEESQNQVKPTVADKAIEVQTLKQPTEDKSVEICNIPLQEDKPSTSVSVQVDLLRGGIMDFQRRNLGSKLMSHENGLGKYSVDRERTLLENNQSSSHSENWSSTSYFSLPSNHGMPSLSRPRDPLYATTSTKVLTPPKDCIPLSKAPIELDTTSKPDAVLFPKEKVSPTKKLDQTKVSPTTEKPDGRQILDQSLRKSKLAYYVKKVADKYLENNYIKASTPCTSRDVDDAVTRSDRLSSSFYQKRMEEAKASSSAGISQEESPKLLDRSSFEGSVSLESSSPENPRVPMSLYWGGLPYQREENSVKTDQEFYFKSTNVITPPTKAANDKVSRDPHRFRDLSTILEIDSAYTNDTVPSFIDLSSSFKKLSTGGRDRVRDRKCPEDMDVSPVSLLEPPSSKISELAKSIKFVSDTTDSKRIRESLPIVSGTLEDLQTPKSNIETSTPRHPPSLTRIGRELHEHRTITTESGMSSLLAASQRTPYSSSFQDSYRRPPYLTDVDTLPKYFEDVSTVKQSNRFIKYHGGFEMTPFKSSYMDAPSFPPKLPIEDKEIAPKNHGSKQVVSPDSSGGSFKPASPYISSSHSPRDGILDKVDALLEKQYESSSGSFKAPRSYISSSTQSPQEDKVAMSREKYAHKKLTHACDQNISDSSSSMKPPTHFSYSSSNEQSSHSQERIVPRPIPDSSKKLQRRIPSGTVTEEDSAESFTNITPGSYISSPATSGPHSPFKSRGGEVMDENIKYQHESIYSEDSSETFKSPEYPRSGNLNTRISVPLLEETLSLHSLHSNNSSASSKSSLLDPLLNVLHKFRVTTDAKYLFSDLNPDMESPSDPHYFQYNFSMGDGSHFKQNQIGEIIADAARNANKLTFAKSGLVEKENHAQKSTEVVSQDCAKSCGSGFFVPQLHEKDLQSVENSEANSYKIKSSQSEGFDAQLRHNNYLDSKDKKSTKFLLNSKNAAELCIEDKIAVNRAFEDGAKKCGSDFFVPQLEGIEIHLDAPCNKNRGKIMAVPCQSAEFVPKLSPGDFPDSKIAESTSPNSKNVVSNGKDCHLSNCNGSKNKLETLVLTLNDKFHYPTRNNSSADKTKENLSSKILKNIIQHHVIPISYNSSYQSTARKTFEEITEETGIMEEPELTLMKSEMTLRLESPEKEKLCFGQKRILESVEEHPESLTEHIGTPEQVFFSGPVYSDSPSLISFMRHEISCLSDDTLEASPMPQTPETASIPLKSAERKVKLPCKKTPGKEYKARTKRLYNNLEEVKSRKGLEERKDQMMKNRQKMKEYAKHEKELLICQNVLF